jgi:phosphoglycerol transferase MdoB-like AlkP superfamily enzyme
VGHDEGIMSVQTFLGRRLGLVLLFGLLFLLLQTAVRVGLLFFSSGEVAWDSSLLASFGWGFLFDLGTAAWTSLPLVVLLTLLPRDAFERRSLRLLFHLGAVAFVGGLLFSAAAEVIFWEEFGARFNFIAVDYLVYTTEVVGNIRESYNLPLIFAALAVGAAALYHLLGWRTGLLQRALQGAREPARQRYRSAALYFVPCLSLGMALDSSDLPDFANNYNRELAKNGPWSFVAAFRNNELDYEQFYPLIEPAAAMGRVQALIAAAEGRDRAVFAAAGDLLRRVAPARPAASRPNVIQITVESLSASFLGAYGSSEGLTPRLDALAEKSLVFDRFYATGNRTDRGMEALTLGVPPTPGRSLVKRPHNENLFSLGSVFRAKGYRTSFLYGGYSYFDNMGYFFGHNGYQVIDRGTVGRDEVTFANAWGAADEDLLRWTLDHADSEAASGQPFHFFVMTTSNHRPYTYPEGRIDLPSKTSGRRGAVKYTDFAIGAFLDAAAKKSWYQNTIFVVVADHCASSAGKTSLPVERYHIPLLIFAPGGQIAPGRVATLASQVDYPPTLLALLGFSYDSRFYGWDITRLPPPKGRALIGNYQRLGLLLADHRFAILAPVRQQSTFTYDPASHDLAPTPRLDQELVADTIAYYQSASFLFEHDVQKEIVR